MKQAFRDLPLRRKISFFNIITIGVSLLALTAVTILLDRKYSLEDREEQVSLLINTLPYSVRDELYFLEVDELRDLALKIGSEENENVEHFLIYGPDGVILADSEVNYHDTLIMPDQNPDPFGLTLIQQESEAPLIRTGPAEDEITAGRAIYLDNNVIGAASVTISTAPLTQKTNRIIIQSLLLTAGILLLSTLLSAVLSQQLSLPLRELTNVALKMSKSDRSARVKVAAADEIGELGTAFNEMAEAIGRREADLQELTASLEQKVEERTEELRQRNQELLQLATSDPLTQLNNRRHFFALADNEYKRAKRYRHPLSLVIADVDHFKDINDTYGHQTGDDILKNIASFLENNVRNVDIVARYGGEEFVILMPEIGCEYAHKIAERLRRRIAETAMAQAENKIVLTTSFGVACWDQKANLSFDTLLYRADKALYQAKHNGRNRVEVWGDIPKAK